MKLLKSPPLRFPACTLLLAAIFGVLGQASDCAAQGDSRPGAKTSEAAPQNPFPDRPKAPAGILDGGREWLNSSGPISLKDLQGKIVLIDFWTYCCINCIHILPDLKFLEEKYAKELVVIGVHSAKFDNEKDSENIRRAIQRYEIAHPVVNDADMIIWRNFGTNAWPTLALIDPEGRYLGSISGEGHRELLDQIIGRVAAYHRQKGTLDETPVRFELESAKLKPTPLRFPGKVLADARSNRLFISDSNHNRIVITTLDGQLLDVVGTGAMGSKDGAYAVAQFDHPQGMALVGQTLYVADTENHLLRAVDLQRRTVSTLAGTGEQNRTRSVDGGLRAVALNSPWDVIHVDGSLYIAMAGPHQIWRHRLGTDRIEIFAGSGREDVLNGGRLSAALAQPSGLATDGQNLYVCDSEGSSIRKIPLASNGDITTVVGTSDLPNGRSLFEFGDVDGVGSKARLQHPLGIAYHDDTLYVADTYNHKIKKVKLGQVAGTSRTWLGDGDAGDRLDPPRFSEPSGLSIAGDKLYIADTNNHVIKVADLKSGAVSALHIDRLAPPPAANPADQLPVVNGEAIEVKPQAVAPGKALTFDITMVFPEGFKLNTLAPVVWQAKADGDQSLIAAEDLNVRRPAKAEGATAIVEIPLSSASGKATIDLSLTFTYCRDGNGGICKLKTSRWRIPVELSAESAQKQIPLKADATQ